MASIIYKPISEVNLFHDYFLMKDDSSFFALSTEEQTNHINQLTLRDQLDLRKELDILPLTDTARIMRNYKLRMRRTVLGFILYQEVERVITADESVLYRPRIQLTENVMIRFNLRTINSSFKNFSSVRLRPHVPGHFWWSNDSSTGIRVPSTLSQPIEPFTPIRDYEIGELADFSGTIKRAVVHTSSPDPNSWITIPGDGFATEEDRNLISSRLRFRVPALNGLSQITCNLLSTGSDHIKTIQFTNISPGQTVDMDFRTNQDGQDIPSGSYRMLIQSNLGVHFSKVLLIDDQIYQDTNLGLVELSLNEQDPNNNLYDSSGFLLTRKLPDQSIIAHRKFEIRFLSRLSYWRYVSESPFTPETITQTSTHLQVADSEKKVLISKRPRLLSRQFTRFSIPLPSQALPNPQPSPLQLSADGKLYSDIFISDVNKIIQN